VILCPAASHCISAAVVDTLRSHNHTHTHTHNAVYSEIGAHCQVLSMGAVRRVCKHNGSGREGQEAQQWCTLSSGGVGPAVDAGSCMPLCIAPPSPQCSGGVHLLSRASTTRTLVCARSMSASAAAAAAPADALSQQHGVVPLHPPHSRGRHEGSAASEHSSSRCVAHPAHAQRSMQTGACRGR